MDNQANLSLNMFSLKYSRKNEKAIICFFSKGYYLMNCQFYHEKR